MRLSALTLFFLLLLSPASSRVLVSPDCAQSIACSVRAVVSVMPDWPANARRTEEPEGSGVVLQDGTLIATADHVLGPATNVRIRTADGEIADATIILRDAPTDIALLRIERKLPAFGLKADTLQTPELAGRACAIGNAFGLDLSITCGVVSAVGVANAGFNRIEDFVQTDAAVNPGMSGGALVDGEGRLIGMLSAIFTKNSDSNIGVNFAVSVPLLKRVVDDFLDNEQLDRVRPGILIKPARGKQGGEIVRLAAGSPEANAGLRVGDVIISVDNNLFSGPGVYHRALAFIDPPASLVVGVDRDGQKVDVTIQFEK